jgi:polyhydroxyalkanoate synthesis regulator phasin
MNEIVARWFDEVLARSGHASVEAQERLEAQISELERDGAFLTSSESLRQQIEDLAKEVRELEADVASSQAFALESERAREDLRTRVTARLLQESEALLERNRVAVAAETVAKAAAWEPILKEAFREYAIALDAFPPGQLEKFLGQAVSPGEARSQIQQRLQAAFQTRSSHQSVIDRVQELRRSVADAEGTLAQIRRTLTVDHDMSIEALNQLLALRNTDGLQEFLEEQLRDARIEAGWNLSRNVFHEVQS